MRITPISLYLLKRKINFLLELLNNQATNELVANGIHTSMSDTINKLKLETSDKSRGENRYRGIIRSTCINKLAIIRATEKKISESDLGVGVLPYGAVNGIK